MGSLAPEGSVIGQEVFEAVLHARPFGSKKEDPDAIPAKTRKSEFHPDCE